MKSLKRFKVVLVEPKVPENIGSVARLLENYAVGSAALVNPKCEYKTGAAQWVATNSSRERLNATPELKSLKEAVKGSRAVVGFTTRSGRTRKLSLKLEELATKLTGEVALVFGREDKCLNNAEIEECTHLCTLDSSSDFPALNLSHSVAVVLSSLYAQEVKVRKGHREVAAVEDLDPMFEQLREMMIEAGLTKAGNPDRMLLRLKKIYQRAALSKTDIALLRGLHSTVMKALKKF